MNKFNTISIDLAKSVFQVAVFNRHGKRKLNQAMSKKKMLTVISQHPGATICIEACA
ncbi:IS110 family transposase, partial [Vibrio sp. 10N.286.46.E10]